MEREVFVLPDGDSFFASSVEFGALERHRESTPATFHERDGTTRPITVHFTVETAQVSFRLPCGSVREGMRGQLSTAGDIFFEVTILSVQATDEHLVVSGRARRTFDHEHDG